MERLGVEFDAVPASVDEAGVARAVRTRDPASIALAVSRAKVRAVAGRHPTSVVITADTVVSRDGEMLGKPEDAADAAGMLRRLEGRDHTVVTGVVVTGPQDQLEAAITARVRMRALSPMEIEDYVRSDEPLDKAGAYAIQGLGGLLIQEVAGCYLTVVGFPLCAVATLLNRVGATDIKDPDGLCAATALGVWRQESKTRRHAYAMPPHPALRPGVVSL